MSERNFREMLERRWAANRFVCVGLDTDFSNISEEVKATLKSKGKRTGEVSAEDYMVDFNREIVASTWDLVCAYKPNIAFYEAQSWGGVRALIRTTAYIQEHAPEVPIILDAKRADIGNTNRGYVEAAFNIYGVDAITVHPYLGRDALQPFLDQKDKGIIVLCRTSNPGAGEFQDLEVKVGDSSAGSLVQPLYQIVAEQVATKWNSNGNCAVVVGATFPHELKWVRKIVGDMPILIPGIGTQGGDVEKTVEAGIDSKGGGMIINSSRGIIFASAGEDFAEAARKKTLTLHIEIQKYLK